MTSNNLVRDAAAQVREMILAALKAAMEAGELPQAEIPAFAVEIPADTSHGDFASNIAMAGARAFRCAPPKIAAAVLNHLDFNGTWFARAESAGPGFLNFFLRPQWFAAVL